jgi:hypothetical protein
LQLSRFLAEVAGQDEDAARVSGFAAGSDASRHAACFSFGKHEAVSK